MRTWAHMVVKPLALTLLVTLLQAWHRVRACGLFMRARIEAVGGCSGCRTNCWRHGCTHSTRCMAQERTWHRVGGHGLATMVVELTASMQCNCVVVQQVAIL